MNDRSWDTQDDTLVAPLVSLGGSVQALLQTGLTVAHSLRARGPRRTVALAALAVALPCAAEHLATRRARVLRHRLRRRSPACR